MGMPAGGVWFECESAARDVATAVDRSMSQAEGCSSSTHTRDAESRMLNAANFPVLTVKVRSGKGHADAPGRVTETRTIKRGTLYCVTIRLPDNVAPEMMVPYMNGFSLADWMARGLFIAYHRAKQLYLTDRKSSKEGASDD